MTGDRATTPTSERCWNPAHWYDACPNCGSRVRELSRSCWGDPHVTYDCWACGWRGRSGLQVGSPNLAHDDALHLRENGSREVRSDG